MVNFESFYNFFFKYSRALYFISPLTSFIVGYFGIRAKMEHDKRMEKYSDDLLNEISKLDKSILNISDKLMSSSTNSSESTNDSTREYRIENGVGSIGNELRSAFLVTMFVLVCIIGYIQGVRHGESAILSSLYNEQNKILTSQAVKLNRKRVNSIGGNSSDNINNTNDIMNSNNSNSKSNTDNLNNKSYLTLSTDDHSTFNNDLSSVLNNQNDLRVIIEESRKKALKDSDLYSISPNQIPELLNDPLLGTRIKEVEDNTYKSYSFSDWINLKRNKESKNSRKSEDGFL